MEDIYSGLSDTQATELLTKYGKNSLEEHRKTPAIVLFFRQFADVMTIILIVCTGVSFFMKDWVEALVMMGIIVCNAILGFIQEYKTEKTIEALREMTALKTKVIRNGTEQVIAGDYVVPGDIIMLRSGDIVSADAIVLKSTGLCNDESMLTGESVPVYKESKDMIYSGTLVVGGSCIAKVTATGMSTRMGEISKMISNVKKEATPLQKRLAKLGKYIVAICVVVCILVTLVGVLKGEPLMEMLMAGISLAVAAVPEGLPAIVTIALALGVQRMAANRALVRKLPAVETLGTTTVICSDKTGTLTQNKMSIRKVVTAMDALNMSIDNKELNRLADVCRVCNNNSDATEKALIKIRHFLKLGTGSHYTRIKEKPFDSTRKCMSVVVRDKNGDKYIFTKGGADVILNKCTSVMIKDRLRGLDSTMRHKLEEANNNMANQGLRVLGISWKKLDQNGEKADIREDNMIFCGFVGLIDPLRPEVRSSVHICRQAGIRTVMITGDHKLTAAAIGKELGISGGEVITGDDIEKMSDSELQQAAQRASCFARVTPAHKLRIVKAYKSLGNVVAMTGDGVNDAPAVKEADIGIAMGINGTDVTREASSMVLTDDNFATIVDAVREGRVIYSNIRKFIRYMLACNLGEVVTMFIGILFGLPLPLLPIQILWVNLVTDGLPGIALGLDKGESDIMQRPPISPKEGLFSGKMPFHIIIRGILIGLCTLGAFVCVNHATGSLEIARTTAFMTLVMTQLVHSFECLSENKTLSKIDIRKNQWLLMATAVSLLMMVAVIYMPAMQVVFKTTALMPAQLGVVLGFTAIGPLVSEIIR
ncbi:MAG: cation-translocating P-type ATPase [Ruminococcaceae bacterium]|nr:cation-translocating P-type ATPase [Oscillospiraceae bacterium]